MMNTPPTLSATERAVLELERSWFKDRGATPKAGAIRARLGMSPTRYYALLGHLLDAPAALSFDPLLIRRLRRRRTDRRRARFNGEVPRQRQPR